MDSGVMAGSAEGWQAATAETGRSVPADVIVPIPFPSGDAPA